MTLDIHQQKKIIISRVHMASLITDEKILISHTNFIIIPRGGHGRYTILIFLSVKPYPELDENLYILWHQLKALSISRQHLLKA